MEAELERVLQPALATISDDSRQIVLELLSTLIAQKQTLQDIQTQLSGTFIDLTGRMRNRKSRADPPC